MRQCFYEQGHQCKLPRVTTLSASRVFALVEGRKKHQRKLLKVTIHRPVTPSDSSEPAWLPPPPIPSGAPSADHDSPAKSCWRLRSRCRSGARSLLRRGRGFRRCSVPTFQPDSLGSSLARSRNELKCIGFAHAPLMLSLFPVSIGPAASSAKLYKINPNPNPNTK